MTAPIYLAACVCTIAFAFSSDYFSERGYHGAIATAMGSIGYLLLVVTRHSPLAVRYISLIICTCGVYAFIPVQLSWPSSNIGGHTKKAVAIAFIISFAQIGSVVGGQLYREYDGKKLSYEILPTLHGTNPDHVCIFYIFSTSLRP